MKLKTFRIEEDSKGLPQRHETTKKTIGLQRLAQDVRRENKFFYIDINSQTGFRIMKECDSSDEEEEMQSIGKRYRVNLNDLSTSNSKAIRYIHKLKESSKKKQKAMALIKQKLNKSTEKILETQQKSLNSTRYLTKKREESYNSTQSKGSSSNYSRTQENKLLSLLNRSFANQPNYQRNFQTLPTNRYSEKNTSPQRIAQKYIQRIKLVLPGIKDHRRTILI